MRNFTLLLSLVSLSAFMSVAADIPAKAKVVVAPNNLLNPRPVASNTLNTEGSETNFDSIVSAAQNVDQKLGIADDAPPDQPPPPTTVITVDGKLTNETIPTSTTRRSLYLRKKVENKLDHPRTPEGYHLVFGPVDGANNAPGYMGFAFIDKYDVEACAQLCNTRGPDPMGGACQYFNIWRAVVDGVPTTYTCSFYYLVADQSTANNFGQGNLKVTYSRGYKRKSLVDGGGFESFHDCPAKDICWTQVTGFWAAMSPPHGDLDAEIIHHKSFAHSGKSAGLLGSGFGTDSLSGTLKYLPPLDTKPGRTYLITFFHSSAFDSLSDLTPFVDVMWNKQIVQTIMPGISDWKYFEVKVVAEGNDHLAFHGGRAPAWSFIDDVFIYLA